MTGEQAENFLNSKTFSDSIFAIAHEIEDLIRLRGFMPNIELESMLLRKTDEGELTNKIPMDEFKNLLRDVVKVNETRIAMQSDKKNWLATEDKFYLGGKIRESIISNSGEQVWIQKDHLQRQILAIPQLPYGLCISIKREKPIENFDKTLYGQVCFIRMKQRFSIWWLNKPFRTDFTLVHCASSRELLQIQPPSQTALYQIETEFVSDESNLAKCKLSREDFAKEYDLESPFLSEPLIKQRQNKIACELLEFSLLVVNPQKTTTCLSLNLYPKKLYIG